MFLVKQADGSFSLTVPLPPSEEKFLYKYVVDGEWKTAPHERVVADESGNENNVLEKSDIVEAASKSSGSAIPEAGGLVAATTLPVTDSDLKTTVLPSQEGKHATIQGEPGIHVPTDPEALKAFETYENVDPKTLNEPEAVAAGAVATEGLNAEEKKKQKKKVKRKQYKAKKKKTGAVAGAAGASSGVETEETEEQTPEPESAEASEVSAPADLAKEEIVDETKKDKAVDETVAAAKEPASTLDPKATEAAAAAVGGAAVLGGGAAVAATSDASVKAPVAASETPVKAPVAATSEAPVKAPVATEKEVDASPVIKSEEPAINGSAPVEAVEAAAAPVAAAKKSFESGEEIVIAHNAKDAKDIEQQILADQNGDYTIEEIKPTESEAQKLAEEANIPASPAKESKKTAEPKKEAPKKDAKDAKKKKKSGFWSKVKKIFD